jgi:transposase-like protein
MGRSRRRQFSPEFKAEALRMVSQSDDSLAKIARDLGLSRVTLRNWVAKAAQPVSKDALSETERGELARLRRENRQLQMERDILKKATAFFARHSE